MSFGSDFAGVDDLDANLTFLEGDKAEMTALAQATARRLTTPRNGLFYDLSYGEDIRSFVSDSIPPALVSKMLSAEVKKDQRIRDCTTVITVVGDTWTVIINPTATTGQSFTLTISVSSVTVELLSIQV